MPSQSGPTPRVVIVTGASSGIGRATSHGLAEKGDHLVLVARGISALEETERECRDLGAASTSVHALDVGDDDAVARLVTAVRESFGRIDAVVHAAAVVTYGRTEDVPVEVFDAVIGTNLLGSVNLARHVIPVMREQDHGVFLQVGSLLGHMAAPTMTPYVVSKWGVRALARQLQLENRDKRGVHIAYVAPGGVDTPIYRVAANYSGFAGRPPPPVASPERVAKTMVDQLDRPRLSTQVGASNHLLRIGFRTVPFAFDLLVGPLLRVAARDLTRPIAPWSGNVLESQPSMNKVHGAHGNATVATVRSLALAARRRLRGDRG